MRCLTLQLVKRELPAPEHDVERVRQIMFANLRRRVTLNAEMPFEGNLDPRRTVMRAMKLDREWVAQWLADSNMADQAQSITATNIRDCVCNTCQGNSNPGLLDHVVGSGAAYHFHWKRNGVARSVGIVSLMPLDVLRDWALPNEMKSEPELVRALEMLVDDRTQPDRSPLALMEDFEDAVDRIRGQRFDRIVADDPVVEEPITEEKRRQAQQWMSKLVLGRDDTPGRPLSMAVNHFTPKSHLAGDTSKPRRRRKRRRRR